MFDLVRSSLHRALATPVGDGLLPIRVPKDLARRMNVALGEPLCSREELVRRREARAKLAELRRAGDRSVTADAPEAATAPVMIYVEAERRARVLGRLKELLDAKGIAYSVLDVTDDQATKDFVMREARCKEDELPVVFVAGSAVGGYDALVEWDVSGRLARALRGAT